MNVTLLAIEAREPRQEDGAQTSGTTPVRVLVELDGSEQWYELEVRSGVLPGVDTCLVVASDALQDVFRHEQHALHRICKLVGRELRGRRVRLPQQIAA